MRADSGSQAVCGLAREAPNRKMCHIFPRCVHNDTELIHVGCGWQYMAVTLAPIAPDIMTDIPHYGMYKHTDTRYMYWRSVHAT